MIIALHVLIALTSVGQTTYVFFKPSLSRLRITYALVGLTLASGTFLVVSTKARMLEACTMGLIYIAGVSVAIVAARHKLAQRQASIKD